jgi:predicted Na+-dependent transporter
MTQTKLGSFIEAWINVLIGFVINYIMNLLILPLFGFHISLTDNILMGLLYTIVSVARSYVVRRWFNDKIHQAALRLAKEQ